MTGTIEVYHPRDVLHLGQWNVDELQLKVYGIVAENRTVEETTEIFARSFVQQDVLPRVAAEEDQNGLGFIIIHPGQLGISILAHWWIQGSVLCQHNYRKLYSAIEPVDISTRSVLACIWELAVINAGQEIWRRTMMRSRPDSSAYLEERYGSSTA